MRSPEDDSLARPNRFELHNQGAGFGYAGYASRLIFHKRAVAEGVKEVRSARDTTGGCVHKVVDAHGQWTCVDLPRGSCVEVVRPYKRWTAITNPWS